MEGNKTYRSDRINILSNAINAKKYLEIGVATGKTFFKIDTDFKVAVDVNFLFNEKDRINNSEHYFKTTSDNFFQLLSENNEKIIQEGFDNSIKFDLIFIDGLHTFQQSFCDFQNSIQFSHEKTIWVIDDSVPSDPYNALPDYEKSLYYKDLANIPVRSWQGDVFKTIFAIHDCYPDFSYCTPHEYNPQTIVWRKPGGSRKPVFSSIEDIESLTYFDMMAKADLLGLVSWEEGMALIGKEYAPVRTRTLEEEQRLLARPIENYDFFENKVLKKYVDELENRIRELEAQKRQIGDALEKARELMMKMMASGSK